MCVMFREPTIDEMLSDPIVLLLMKHDGVEEEQLRHLVRAVRRRLISAPEPVTASDDCLTIGRPPIGIG